MGQTESKPKWTHDSQGKQDYDSAIVSLRCRYYPRGGGFSEYDVRTGRWYENGDRPHIKPSAVASLMLEDECIAEAQFCAETEDEVKASVEAWADEQLKKVRCAIFAGLHR